MWRVVPSNPATGSAWHSEHVQTYVPLVGTERTDNITLVTMGPLFVHGVFKSVSITSATTTTVAAPHGGGSLLITDIVVSAKKVNGTTLDVEFDDGVNTEILLSPDSINQSVNFAWQPVGRIQGWEDAALKIVTTGANTVATVTVGYVQNPSSVPYAEWNSAR